MARIKRLTEFNTFALITGEYEALANGETNGETPGQRPFIHMTMHTGAAALLIDVRADSRERLLHVAMRLFAEHGIDGVSLKMISDAAGNRNKSAVCYHFESKLGLVHAVLHRLHEDFAPQIDARLTAFERAIAARRPPSLDDVVLGLLEPVMVLFAVNRYGPDALRALARIMHEPLREMPLALRTSAKQLTRRVMDVLHRIMPEKPLAELELHLHHAIMATVNGLAMHRRFLETHESLWGQAPLDEIFLSYAGYVAAGLAGRGLVLPPEKAAAWRLRLQPPGG